MPQTVKTGPRIKTTVPRPGAEPLTANNTATWFQVRRFVEARYPGARMVTRQRIEQLRNGYRHAGTGREYPPGMEEGTDFVYIRGFIGYSRGGVDKILSRLRPPARLTADDWSVMRSLPDSKCRERFDARKIDPERIGIVSTPDQHLTDGTFPDLLGIQKKSAAIRKTGRKPADGTSNQKKRIANVYE